MLRHPDTTTTGSAPRAAGPTGAPGVAVAGAFDLDPAPGADAFDAFRQWATTTPLDHLDAAALLDRARAIEELTRALTAAAGQTAMAFDRARRDHDRPRGIDPERTRKTVVSELALARRVSPWRAARDLSTAIVAASETPHTWAALRAGDITPASLTHVLAATAMLDRDDRATIDETLHHGPGGTPRPDGHSALRGMGDKQIDATARRLAYDLDPANLVAANAIAESQRYVSIRPKPDCMIQLTAILPMAAGVAAYAGLVRAADAARAAGDPRGKAQVMADTLLTRLTTEPISTDPIAASTPAPTPVAVTLVVTDTTLHATASTPATLVADGITPTPVPAPLARRLVHESGARVERIATLDKTGRLATLTDRTGRPVPTESTGRAFPDGLATLITLRDQTCTTPWCDAPIRHTDHITPWHHGGPTTLVNGTGRCEHCNHTKQHPDWHEHPEQAGYTITTPTGLRYPTGPPPLLRSPRPRAGDRRSHRRQPDDDDRRVGS